VLTMAVGVSAPLRIHSYKRPHVPNVLFLLCSDGLHSVVDFPLIESILAFGDTLEEKCRNLVDAARRGGGPDNITVVLLRAVPHQ
jgi:PPM family protein phosphatase